jgi:hypothetical protein
MMIAAAEAAAAAADPGLAVSPPVTGTALTSAVNAVTGTVTALIYGRAG